MHSRQNVCVRATTKQRQRCVFQIILALTFPVRVKTFTMRFPLIGQNRPMFIGNLGLFWIYFYRLMRKRIVISVITMQKSINALGYYCVFVQTDTTPHDREQHPPLALCAKRSIGCCAKCWSSCCSSCCCSSSCCCCSAGPLERRELPSKALTAAQRCRKQRLEALAILRSRQLLRAHCPGPRRLQKRHFSLSTFVYVCPEPVLAKIQFFLSTKWCKKDVFRTATAAPAVLLPALVEAAPAVGRGAATLCHCAQMDRLVAM